MAHRILGKSTTTACYKVWRCIMKILRPMGLTGLLALAGCGQSEPAKPPAPARPNSPDMPELLYRIERLEQAIKEPRVVGGQERCEVVKRMALVNVEKVGGQRQVSGGVRR